MESASPDPNQTVERIHRTIASGRINFMGANAHFLALEQGGLGSP
jgi:hypothetical protein